MFFSFTRRHIFLALACLTALALFFPTLAAAWQLNQANAHLARAASLPADAPRRALELQRAQSVIESARAAPRLALADARLAALRGDFAAAIAALESTRALDADFIAQFVAGAAAYQAGDSARAATHWRAAGAFDYFLRNAYRAQSQHLWREAERLARIAASIAPESAAAQYVLGDALARQDVNTAAAFEELERAQGLTRDPEFLATILARQAEIYFAQGNLPAAIAQFERARALAPLDARPRTGYALASVRLDARATPAATALLQQVIADSPWYTQAYTTLAEFAQARGDFVDAERWLTAGLEKNRNDAHLLFARGHLFARQNQIPRAREAFIAALRGETHSDHLLEIAHALRELEKK